MNHLGIVHGHSIFKTAFFDLRVCVYLHAALSNALNLISNFCLKFANLFSSQLEAIGTFAKDRKSVV